MLLRPTLALVFLPGAYIFVSGEEPEQHVVEWLPAQTLNQAARVQMPTPPTSWVTKDKLLNHSALRFLPVKRG